LNKTGDQEAKVKKIPEWQKTKKEDNSGYLLSFQYLNEKQEISAFRLIRSASFFR